MYVRSMFACCSAAELITLIQRLIISARTPSAVQSAPLARSLARGEGIVIESACMYYLLYIVDGKHEWVG